ncbi:MAG: rhodanese-like domain-containing protein [Bacteroidetes bacterium]|nr:rhodanese-like domain-containing protein [Bacteroidota bacterium]
MDADELAFRIVDHEPNIRIIDVRSPKEFAALALPNSYNIQRADLFGKDWVSTFSQRHLKKVVVGDDEAQERTACYLLHELGYENLAILRGGIGTFKNTILDSGVFVPTGSRWDADVEQFREGAKTTILKMIADAKNKPVKTVVKRKIQGGC